MLPSMRAWHLLSASMANTSSLLKVLDQSSGLMQPKSVLPKAMGVSVAFAHQALLWYVRRNENGSKH